MLNVALCAASGKLSTCAMGWVGVGGPLIRISIKLQKNKLLKSSSFLTPPAPAAQLLIRAVRNLQGLRGKQEGKDQGR